MRQPNIEPIGERENVLDTVHFEVIESLVGFGQQEGFKLGDSLANAGGIKPRQTLVHADQVINCRRPLARHETKVRLPL